MVYKRSTKSAGRRPRPRRRRTARKPNQSLASKVVSAVSGYALTKLKDKLGLNTEKHFWQVATTTGSATFATTLAMAGGGTISTQAANMPQGDGEGNRQGNTVRIVRYSANGYIVNGVANTARTTARVIIVNWGKVPYDGFNGNVNDILENTGDVNSYYKFNPSFKHTILYDKQFFLGPTAGSPETDQTVRFNFDYYPMNHHYSYTDSDTTGVIANVVQGFIAAYIICSTFTASNAPTISACQRLEWVDN